MALRFIDERTVHAHVHTRPRELSRTQRNHVANLARENGLRREDFEWGYVVVTVNGQRYVPGLVHKPTGSYFIFDLTETQTRVSEGMAQRTRTVKQFVATYFPSDRGIEVTWKGDDWYGQIEQCAGWLTLVAENNDQPDLWAGAADSDRIPGVNSASADEPFTEEEQKRVTACVDEVEEYLVEVSDVVAAKRVEFKPMFDYLRGAVKRMSRRDWTLTFVGTLMNVAMEAALDGYGFKALFKFAGQQLQLALGNVGEAIGAAAAKLLEKP